MEDQYFENIEGFVKKYSQPSDGHTFKSFHDKKTTFNVSDENLAPFYFDYCELLNKHPNFEEHGTLLGIAETLKISGEVKKEYFTPWIVNISLTFNQVELDDEQPYTDIFLYAIACYAQKTLIEFYLIGEASEHIYCAILESKQNIINGLATYHIRFHFPYTRISYGNQKALNLHLCKKLDDSKINNQIHHSVTQCIWVNFFDKISNVNETFFPLYGSANKGTKPLIFKHMVGRIYPDQVTGFNTPKPNQGHSIETNYPLKYDEWIVPDEFPFINNDIENFQLNTKEDYHYWLPLMLSIHFYSTFQPLPIRKDLPKKKVKAESINSEESEDTIAREARENEATSKNPAILAKTFLNMLNPERFLRDDFFTDIGNALKNIYSPNEGLDLFIEYSAKNGKKLEREYYQNKFYNLKDKRISVKTLAWFAREDNPDQYNEWHANWIKDALEDCLSGTHEDNAELLYRYCWLEYFYDSSGGKKTSWYKFENHHCNSLNDGMALKRDISNILVPALKKMRIEISVKMAKTTRTNAEKKHNDDIDKIKKLEIKLKNQGFRSSVVNLAQEYFEISNFSKFKDNNPNKMGWINGVSECGNKKIFFKPGKPEDFITMCTHIPFKEDFNWDSPEVVDVLKWLSCVFVDEDLLEYFLRITSSLLQAKNSDKIFQIWTGNGNNSKSMIVKLFQQTLGDYCIDFPVSMLCKTFSNSSGPSPEMAQAEGSHVGIISEPDADEPIQAGKLKRMSGGDRQFTRKLNENGGSQEAFYKIIMMCNRIPDIPGIDAAVKNRLRIIPFLSLWIKNAPDTEDEQIKTKTFKLDPFFDEKIAGMCPAFAWILAQKFYNYKTYGLNTPKIVLDYTEKHVQDNDPYTNFIKERIIDALKPGTNEKDMTQTLTAQDIYQHFKSWFRDNYPGSPLVNGTLFRTEIITRIGVQTNRRWYGIKMHIPMVNLPV